jgi:hypothetical protein
MSINRISRRPSSSASSRLGERLERPRPRSSRNEVRIRPNSSCAAMQAEGHNTHKTGLRDRQRTDGILGVKVGHRA